MPGSRGRGAPATPRNADRGAFEAGAQHHRQAGALMPQRRFPTPWSVEEPDPKLDQRCFIVRDANGAGRLCLFRGGVGRAGSGKATDPRRSPAHCGEHRIALLAVSAAHRLTGGPLGVHSWRPAAVGSDEPQPAAGAAADASVAARLFVRRPISDQCSSWRAMRSRAICQGPGRLCHRARAGQGGRHGALHLP